MLNQFTRTLSACALGAVLAQSATSADWTAAGDAVAFRNVAGLPLGELIDKTAGGISDKGLSNFLSFDEYWRANQVSRVGKAYEAYAAHTANTRFQAAADSRRLMPTAALGRVQDKADLLLVDGDRILGRVQSKLGLRELEDAVTAVDYRRMQLVTCQETYDQLRNKLVAESEKAARRGLELSGKLKATKAAMDSGRIWSKLPCGSPLPTRADASAITRQHYAVVWTARAAASGVSRPLTASARKRPQGLSPQAIERAQSTLKQMRERHGSPRQPAIDALANNATKNVTPLSRPKAAGGPQARSSTHNLHGSKSVPAAKSTVWSAAGKVAARVVGFAAFGYELFNRGRDISTTEAAFDAGELTQEERELGHAGTVGGFAGGLAGGIAGGQAGAVLGAEAGTLVAPGPGTAVGGVTGAVVGGVGGVILGEKVAQTAAQAATKAVHRAGTTVAEVGGKAVENTKQAVAVGYRGVVAGAGFVVEAGQAAGNYASDASFKLFEAASVAAHSAERLATKGLAAAAAYADKASAVAHDGRLAAAQVAGNVISVTADRTAAAAEVAADYGRQASASAYDNAAAATVVARTAARSAVILAAEGATAVANSASSVSKQAAEGWKALYRWASE